MGGRATWVLRLAVPLRLAVRLHRSRSDRLPTPLLAVEEDDITLSLDAHWLEDHPLARADLQEEAALLAAAGFRLVVAPIER